MNKRNFITLVIGVFVVSTFLSCGNPTPRRSNTTGWAYNDPTGAGIEYKRVTRQQAGPGLIFIPGGTFVIGQTQEDIMGDWNNSPRRVTVASFYMDEHEVRNIDWLEYLNWLQKVHTSRPEVYKNALPDTLVWREQLSYNEPMVKNYLRFPAYNEYPVVGVSWEQANEYCIWRTDRVNEMILIQHGYLTPDFENQKDANNFNTEAYLAGQYEGTAPRRGRRNANQSVKWEDGILLPSYRLPTEAEWEYAAYGLIGNGDKDIYAPNRIYPWDGTSLRNNSKKHSGQMMANFVRARGDYLGTASRTATGGFDYTSPVKSFWPNDFGLFDMAGNVNEWVADVYRPMTFQDMAEFNPFRGNVFKVEEKDANGNLVPKDEMGRIKYRLQTDEELANRENYRTADNRNYNDGDLKSRISPEEDWKGRDDKGSSDMYYADGEEIVTNIDDEARVYKGGSWKDRAHWLNPSTRRHLNQKKATNDIGFRCAMSHVGS